MLLAAYVCLVVAITDGDTLKVHCDGQPQTTIRLSAIDAPEKGMPFGQRAKQALSDLCHMQDATIKPRSTDPYGRTLADVECQGKDASTEQVKLGMAWVYDKYSKGYESLYPLQSQAQESHLGLWADIAPEPPWLWRKNKH